MALFVSAMIAVRALIRYGGLSFQDLRLVSDGIWTCDLATWYFGWVKGLAAEQARAVH